LQYSSRACFSMLTEPTKISVSFRTRSSATDKTMLLKRKRFKRSKSKSKRRSRMKSKRSHKEINNMQSAPTNWLLCLASKFWFPKALSQLKMEERLVR